jgi:hypothetical protein
MNKTVFIAFLTAVVLLAGCGRQDDNAKPVYADSGLPLNCRAYIQTAINGYRSKQYTADETINGIERNCGVGGYSWKNMRDN